MVSTLGSPWVQQQELVPGDPATGPPYYSGGTETGDQRTNERTTLKLNSKLMSGPFKLEVEKGDFTDSET